MPEPAGAIRRLATPANRLRVIDQLLASATNLALPFVAALALDSYGVGIVWIVVGTWQCASALVRGLVSQPVQLAVGREGGAVAVPPTRRAVAPAAVLAVGLAVIAVVFTEGELRSSLVVLAVALPFMLLGDYGRHCAYSIRRVSTSVVASVVWVVVLMVGMAVTLGTGVTPTRLVAAWVIGGAVSGVLMVEALRPFVARDLRPSIGVAQRVYLGVDALTGQLGAFAVPVVGGWTVGLSTVGVFQNSRLLFRPLNVLLNLVLVGGIPAVLGRSVQDSILRTRRLAALTVAVAAALAALGLGGYVAVATLTSVELSVGAVVLGAVESVVVGPYLVYALLAATMHRAGVLLAIRVAAVATQIAAVMLLSAQGALGLAIASLLGVAVAAAIVPAWVTATARPATPVAA